MGGDFTVGPDDGHAVGNAAEDASPAQGSQPSVTEVVEVMRQAVGQFSGPGELEIEQVLRLAVTGLRAVVPTVTCAGVTVLEAGGRLRAAVAGGERLERLQQAQAVLREGPSVTAVHGVEGPAGREFPVVWVQDLSTETGPRGRWPRFAAEALRLDVRSVLSLPIPPTPRRDTVLSLDLFAAAPGALDPAARLLAQTYAQHAATALDNAQRLHDLQRAVQSRDALGQAKGILMQRHRIDAGAAWTMLIEASQATSMKVVDVAAWLINDLAEPTPTADFMGLGTS